MSWRKRYTHPRYGECCSRSPQSMPTMFHELANYNGRVNQGVIHTDAYAAKMAELQAHFNEWSAEVNR